MSVKVEYRPENRFQCYVAFERLEFKLIEQLQKDTSLLRFECDYGQYLKHAIYNQLILARTNMLAANSLNVFDDIQYPERVKKLDAANTNLIHIKSILEMYFAVSDNEPIKLYSEVIHDIDDTSKKLVKLLQSDAQRHLKGQKAVHKEFLDSKKKNFFVSKTVDHTKTDPKVLDHKDPFDITKLTLIGLDDKEFKINDEQFK